MPAPIDPKTREKIIRDLASGITAVAVAKRHGVSRRSVVRLKRDAAPALEAAKSTLTKAGPRPIAPEVVADARERVAGDLGAALRGIASRAVERVEDALKPGAEPHAVQARVATWALDKAIPSADAKEGRKGLEALAEVVRSLQSDGDDSRLVEFREVWAAQDREMERRRRLLAGDEGEGDQ